MYAVRQWLLATRIDVLVTFFRDSNIVGTLAARSAHVPVISSRRNIGRGYWHTPLEIWILRILNRFTASFIANSEAVRDYTTEAEHVSPDRIIVIPNAVDLGRFRPRSIDSTARLRRDLQLPPGFLIACVANLRPIKSIDVLIDAFASLKPPGTEASLILVGAGPERASLESLATGLGVGGWVHFLGNREDVPDILAAVDLTILPSSGEGCPNAVLEYMAAELPIIATQIGGVPEVLHHGIEGMLIPPRDVTALATAIEKLLRSPEERSGLGQAARRRVERDCSLHKTVGHWTSALRNEVVRHRGTRS